ncbi:hypothetical protein TrST_g1707 [Triparma strigata]|uniref:Uncharacterized protein n=1 Tax=Triparma strigata TaxID=1606541 RepID=A0A9W6ZNL5_9STRA|nr:hypothetical protein TrST_g1707 [Triparma strigata]
MLSANLGPQHVARSAVDPYLYTSSSDIDLVLKCVNSSDIVTRFDGRSQYEIRSRNISLARDEGISTSTVTIQSPNSTSPNTTKVQCTISSQIVPTNGSNGRLTINASFANGPQLNPPPIATLHHLTTILTSLSTHLLNPTSLSIIKSTHSGSSSQGYAYNLTAKIVVLSSSCGSLLDCAATSLVSSLRIYPLPSLKITPSGLPLLLPSTQKPPTLLPIQHTPISLTYSLFPTPLLDPTSLEETSSEGFITVMSNSFGEVCLVDFQGKLNSSKLADIVRDAVERSKPLGMCMEDTVSEFLKDWEVKLERSKLKSNEIGEGEGVAEDVVRDVEQEEYRKMALSYSLSHVAAKITSKEETGKKRKKGRLEEEMIKYLNEGGKSDSDEEDVVMMEGTKDSDVKTDEVKPGNVLEVVDGGGGERVEMENVRKNKIQEPESDSDSDSSVDLAAAVKKKKKAKKSKK